MFGRLVHVGRDGKKSKTGDIYCPTRKEDYNDGGTSDLVLDGSLNAADLTSHLNFCPHS